MPAKKPCPNEFHAALREQMPVKATVLADRYNLSRARISQIMNGATDPPLWFVLELYVRDSVDLLDAYFQRYKPTHADWRMSMVILQRETGRMAPPNFMESENPAREIRYLLKQELPDEAFPSDLLDRD